MKVINLLSGPRNISTALMYSFAQHENFVVIDEPFYGHYLKNATLNVTHPSHSKIVEMMECDEGNIVQHINSMAVEKNVFIKGMAHHLLSEEPEFILDWTNVILIRHPAKLIASFAKVIPNPTLADIGLKKAAELVAFLKRSGKNPIVIDSDELMVDPEKYLQKLYRLLDIPFSKKILSWKTGGIPEDGVWAAHWYENVHRTTGFEVQHKKQTKLDPQLGPLLAEALPYYMSLQHYILKND